MKTQENNINKIALSLAYSNFSKGLNLHAFYKIKNKEMCSDLVQETFMKTYVYLLKGDEIIFMRAFLYHVLNNLIIDEYRKKKNLSLDELIEKGYEPSSDEEERLINFLDGEKAMSLIEKLPEKYKECITMKYVDDLSLEEMSLMTGQTRKTLAVQVHRGLKKLKVLYVH
jgi:RNA polymerase sigma-70 factor (ECF subfamily)